MDGEGITTGDPWRNRFAEAIDGAALWRRGTRAIKLLSVLHPGLVMVDMTGFSEDGPAKDRPEFGRIAQAFGSLMYLCGVGDCTPANSGSATIADYVSGLFAAVGVLVAERHGANGRRQVLDMALYEGFFRILDSLAVTYSGNGTVRERTGTATTLAALHNPYRTRAGRRLAIARLAALMGKDELGQRSWRLYRRGARRRARLHPARCARGII